MPVKRVNTSKGPGYRFGEHGRIYHYKANDEASRKRAKKNAEKQERAIRGSGWKEK